MAITTTTFLVTKEVAERSGLLNFRYRVADGRFVLDNKDLARIRLTAEELVSGISGIEKTSASEAKKLIAKNGFKMGTSNIGENDHD